MKKNENTDVYDGRWGNRYILDGWGVTLIDEYRNTPAKFNAQEAVELALLILARYPALLENK